MKIRIFPVILAIIAIGFTVAIVVARTNEPEQTPRPGSEQSDNGNEHVNEKEYGGDEPPTSGPHASPIAWGLYETEVRDDQVIHNMEHGGIYVSYNPELPQDQVDKLAALLFEPYSNPNFKPKKVILAPRAANTSPIILSSWLRSEKLQAFDQAKIEQYVIKNTGKSPEPLAN